MATKTLRENPWLDAMLDSSRVSAIKIKAGPELRPAPFRGRVKNVTKEIEARASIRINTVHENIIFNACLYPGSVQVS